ncbi:MAG TPA: GTPase HflX [Verrucomicrobiae bacterium]|nr:GTPase HflX [Verrucomicrobiae bacterium]
MKSLVNLTPKRSERVFLVGVELKNRDRAELRESLDELAELAQTAGAEVVSDGIQKMESLNAATFIGKGKAEEFSKFCKANKIDTVIFDDELSPAQSRNLEKIFRCKIFDRTALILEIFGQRARTREGKMQIELAQLKYLLPRLTRYWSHLSRQRGSTGSIGGEGESQLEADRRKISERIDKIESELDTVRRQRATQRAGRQRSNWPLASIVGYTNAGKSTLLNALTGSEVLAEDKLFATLDPTTRRLRLPTNQNVLLTDTVGFIKKLPHGLVEAFKATLEEVVQANLLLHVVDISHSQAEEQIAAVNSVLKEIGAEGKSVLMVFNKMDKLNGKGALNRWQEKFPHAVGISATTGEGVSNLLAELGTQLRPTREFLELKIPHEQSAVIARLHKVGQIIERRYTGKTTKFKVRIPPQHHAEFEQFIAK